MSDLLKLVPTKENEFREQMFVMKFLLAIGIRVDGIKFLLNLAGGNTEVDPYGRRETSEDLDEPFPFCRKRGRRDED